MNKKILGYILICLLVLICAGVIYFNIANNKEGEFKIITDMKWKTMQNDGGSHTNVYYEIDLDNNIICKKQENYRANLGETPKKEESVVYTKNIDNSIKKEAKSLLNEIIEKEDVNETKNYNFFTIEGNDIEKKIYNINTINNINDFLKKIDEL